MIDYIFLKNTLPLCMYIVQKTLASAREAEGEGERMMIDFYYFCAVETIHYLCVYIVQKKLANTAGKC